MSKLRLASSVAQIGANILWEKATDPHPKYLSSVPPSVKGLTPEWLTLVLCKNHPGAKVLSVERGIKSSGSSDREAFTVTYNEAGRAAGLPTHLFNKCSRGFRTRLLMMQCGTIANECEFYRVVRPELPIEAPTAYIATFDRHSWRCAIILEDMITARNVQFLSPRIKISKERMQQMLSILATVHGRYWESPRLDAEFKWLTTPGAWIRRVEGLLAYKDRSLVGIKRSESVMPKSLIARGDDIWRAMIAAMDVSTRPPLTYLHGDPHIGNYYITQDGRSGLVDWQVTFKGGWGHDFAYTMLSSLDIEDRRNWERELLAYYLERVKEAGARTAPQFDEAWELYRRQTIYTLVGWLYTIGFGPLQPSMQKDEVSLPVIQRAATAVEDLESLKCLGI